MKNIIFKCLSIAVLFFAVVSCKNDMDVDPYQSGDKVKVSFAVGVDGPTKKPQRIADNTMGYDQGDESHTNNPNYESSHQIGDGTLAHKLAYALYTPNGDLVERHDIIVEKFPCQVNLELVRGLKYQLVMWAQSEEARDYYDTQDLCNIFVKYDASDNNDDYRDAFCVSQEVLVTGTSSSSISVVLHRPFAQVNVGISKKVWETLQDGGVYIQASSLSIYNAGCRFNLFKDEVILPTAEDATENRTTADFSKTAVPQETLTINGEDEDYVWVSMSYILANAPKKTDPALVDVVDMVFYYGDKLATAETANTQIGPSTLPMNDVPVRRNYRTNILFDGDLTGTARVVLELNKNFDDADYWAQYDESKELDWHGEIADGVTFRSYRNDDTKKSYYGLFWIDFYVSNENGLRWIADRSNGMPFKKSDIPTWTNSQGKTTTYKIFQNQDGDPDLDVYIAFIKSMVMGHALIPSGVTEGNFNSPDDGKKAYDDGSGNKTTTTIVRPWTFDDCSIILTNDIDFGGRKWLPISSVQFFGISKDSDRGKENFPDESNPFKGEIEGNGHIISNMHIDNRRASDNWWDSYQAGLVGMAAEHTIIKNLTLYNALIEGDWNLGGMVGYYNNSSKNSDYGPIDLIIENCRIENSTLIAYGDSLNSDNDANVGGYAGSVPGKKAILTNCHVNNTILRSDMNVGGFIGILSNQTNEIRNCSMSNVSMILNEFNTGGANEKKKYAERDTRDPEKYLFGSKGGSKVENTSVTDVTLNMFLSDTKKSTAVPNNDGSNYVANIPLNMFPVLDGRYSTSLKIGSHITGTPSYKNYGLYIDISKDPNWKPERETNGFTLEGVVREGKPLYSLNVIPDGETYGIYVHGNENKERCESVVKNLVINGLPTLNAGIYYDKVKTIELNNVAIYDVEYTFTDNNVPEHATLTVTNCDLRGKTKFGKYESALFTGTIFSNGSGYNANRETHANREAQCEAKGNATFEKCVFCEGFKFIINEGVTITLTNCEYQTHSGTIALTKDNVDKYITIEGRGTVTAE